MTCAPQKHHRRSIRLKGYNYSQAGAYFVTICAQDRACLHIIRNRQALDHIRQYILDNPARWAFDRENPAATVQEPEDEWRI